MFLPGIVLIAGLLLALLPNSTVDAEAATGNTTCADTTFDVYTQEAGETPCMPSVQTVLMYSDEDVTIRQNLREIAPDMQP